MSSELEELLIRQSQTLVQIEELLGHICGLIHLITLEAQKVQETAQNLPSTSVEPTVSYIGVEDSAIFPSCLINPNTDLDR